MKFYLSGFLKTSKNLDNPVDISFVNSSVKDAINSDNLKAGVDGKFSIKSEIIKDKILVAIESEYRAHDILFRLKNILAPKLGSKHIGIKEISAESYFVKFNVDKKPLKKFTIPFADISFDGMECTVEIKNLSEDFLRENCVDRIIKLIKEKIEKQYYEGKKEYWRLIWSSEKKNIEFNKDPSIEMANRGWIKQISKGKWFYLPEGASLLNTMKKIAIKEFVEKLKFKEVIESNIKPLDIWLKTGHIYGMPNEIYYVANPKTRDETAWEHFKDVAKITREIPLNELKELVEINYGITYAQCPMIYYVLTNKTISENSLPLKIFEKTAVSARYESGGTHGIERVDEFHRIECVYIGKKEQLLELKEKMIERYKYIFNEILELEWRIASVTPFYMQHSGEVSEEQSPEKGTIDFEAYLPYRGSRENSEWLEFQNLTIVGEKYIKAFNIKTQKGELWSGCTGIGLERWIVSFLAQHGMDQKNWPEKFKEYLEMEEGIEFK